MPYHLEISPNARRNLRRLPSGTRGRLESAILALAEEPRPRGVRKIQGEEQAYRVQVGDYRVLYDVYDGRQWVVIQWVGRRSEDTYRRR